MFTIFPGGYMQNFAHLRNLDLGNSYESARLSAARLTFCFGLKRALCYATVKHALIFVIFLACSVSALASPYTWVLLSFNGPYVNGIPTYTYTIGVAATESFPAMCDDFYHAGAPGDVWKANVTNMANPNLGVMRFGNQGIVPYEEASWLLMQTYSNPSSEWPDMNFAVWHIFNPSVPIDPNSQHWIDLAAANYQDGDYSNVYVVTPVWLDAPPSGDQEFLVYDTSGELRLFTSTPEPGSLALLGTGALTAVAALRRKWKN